MTFGFAFDPGSTIAVQEREIDIEREGIIFETIHSEMK